MIAGMDHHGIDVLLARRVAGQTSMAEKQHAIMQAHSENRNSTQSTAESKEPIGLEGQESTLSGHMPFSKLKIKQKVMQSSSELLMLHDNADTEIERARVSIPISFLF